MEKIYEENPNYKEEIELGFKAFNENRHPLQKRFVEVPVHVIIVHPPGMPIGSGNNFSFDHVMSQINVLNEDFGRYNSDAGNTPAQFPVSDTGIQFCLATVDPNGNATDGITRYATNQDFDSNEFSIKAATGWDRDTYMNIWVAPLPGGLLGYAYLPTPSSLPNSTLDGIVVGSPYFGGPGYATGAPYNLGRTATHEAGHFFGLLHIWRNSGCGQDDGIADTPLQDDSNGGCPTHPSPSCGNSGDMFMNYMDYVVDNCMNAFSTGQGQYMNTILSSSRASLASASGYACAAADPLELLIVDQTDPLCNGTFDGLIQVQAMGGTGNYTYTITPGGSSNNDGLFTGLGAGIYTVSVDDGNTSVSFDITLNDPDILGFDYITQPNVCPDGMEGLIEIFPFGGTPGFGGYMYQLGLETPQSSPVFQNLSGGTYQITLIDENGCSFFDFVNVYSPDFIEITYQDTLDVTCPGDSTGGFTVIAKGGTPAYTYSIGDNFQSSNVFDSIPAGTYIVTVKDGSNCEETDTFTLGGADLLVTETSGTNILDCNGDSDGVIHLNTTGGAGEYLYIFNGDTTQVDSFTNLGSGTYTIITLDTNACQDIDTVVIAQPQELVASIDNQSTTICVNATDGYVNVSSQGGTGPYFYTLNGETNNTGMFINLESGTFSMDIMDNNGCSDNIDFSIETSPEIISSAIATNPLCYEEASGSISVEASGGSGTLSYQLNLGNASSNNEFTGLSSGTYTVNTIDQVGCIFSQDVVLQDPPQISHTEVVHVDSCGLIEDWNIELTINGGVPPYSVSYENITTDLPSGENTYVGMGSGIENQELIIEDNNGCIYILSPEIPSYQRLDMAILDITEASCDGSITGSVQVELSGGTAPYVYELMGTENGDGYFEGLLAGTYELLGTDANNCQFLLSFSVPTNANGFQLNTIEVNQVSCFGQNDGRVITSIAGGVGPYQYVLNGDVNDNGVFEGLSPGNYEVFVTDLGSDCTLSTQFKITEPTELNAELEIEFAGTTEENVITITPSGGTPPYTFAVNDVSDASDNNTFSDLSADDYIFFVIDNNGCIYHENLTLTSTKHVIHSSDFSIYPNPSKGLFYIDLINTISGDKFKINVMTTSGQVLKQELLSIAQNNDNLLIDLSDLPPSIYLLKIEIGNQRFYKKIVKN
jgi:hypothetical protein